MIKSEIKKGGISRRDFLKGAAGGLILVSLFGFLSSCSKMKEIPEESAAPSIPTPSSEDQNEPDPALEEPVDLTSYDSINVLINKKHPLPEDYVPENMVQPDVKCMKDGILLQKEAAEAIEEMFAAAKEDGYTLAIGSAYRSYSYQKTLYENYVQRDGEAAANRYSAKPGQSEHQTGLAADLASGDGYCYLKNCFKDTEEAAWLKENSWKYGFILRYPEEKEEITGYIFEPWHFRYIGKAEAKKVYESGLTLEEYYEMLD